MKMNMKKRSKRNIYYYLALYSGLGLTLVVFTVLCMFVGMHLDKKLGTGSNLALLFTVAGMIIGSWWTYRRILKNALEVDGDDKN